MFSRKRGNPVNGWQILPFCANLILRVTERTHLELKHHPEISKWHPPTIPHQSHCYVFILSNKKWTACVLSMYYQTSTCQRARLGVWISYVQLSHQRETGLLWLLWQIQPWTLFAKDYLSDYVVTLWMSLLFSRSFIRHTDTCQQKSKQSVDERSGTTQ